MFKNILRIFSCMFPLFRNLCCTDSKKILRRQPVKTAVDKAKLCLTIKKATPLIAVADVLSSTLTLVPSGLAKQAKISYRDIVYRSGPLKKTDKFA